jgi:oligopeptide/dipeptide ABC transporter ATP-binding protein
MSLLEIEDLKTHFFTEEGVVRAVDGLNIKVNRGEVVAIVGESGSGKSVTSLSIMRLVADPPGRIVSGAIRFTKRDNTVVDLAKLEDTAMRSIRGNQIAMVFQDPMTSLNPYMKVSDQLIEVLSLHKKMERDEARKRGIEMLTAVGIPDPARRFDDYPHQLSGGMRQRVMIAMALLCEPELLIADEPTTALDVTIQAQILEIFRERKEAMNVGIILITHDLGVVARLADRVCVMYAGRIVEEGTVDEIFGAPAHPYTIGLRRSIPRLDGDRDARLVPIKGMPPSLAKLPKGCPFRPRCTVAEAACEASYPESRVVDREASETPTEYREAPEDGGSPHRVRCHVVDASKRLEVVHG